MAGTVAPAVISHRSRGLVRYDIHVTCDASGVASETIVAVGFGRLVGVFYDGGLDISATVTLKDKKTGAALLTYTTSTEGSPVALRPTTIVAGTDGAAVTAADTAPNVNRAIYIGGKVSLVVAGGGVSETCLISLVIDEDGVGDLALTV